MGLTVRRSTTRPPLPMKAQCDRTILTYFSTQSLTTAKFPWPIVLPTLYLAVSFIGAGAMCMPGRDRNLSYIQPCTDTVGSPLYPKSDHGILSQAIVPQVRPLYPKSGHCTPSQAIVPQARPLYPMSLTDTGERQAESHLSHQLPTP